MVSVRRPLSRGRDEKQTMRRPLLSSPSRSPSPRPQAQTRTRARAGRAGRVPEKRPPEPTPRRGGRGGLGRWRLEMGRTQDGAASLNTVGAGFLASWIRDTWRSENKHEDQGGNALLKDNIRSL
ncbi:uncharacterized protein LOC143679832 [Tamandua tetradactyla]|uniref:uncharacterized protein LOC143679832 n=1 Tax=Tamandua tetradactyla TaxID=48850 RepID=UPI0040548E67